MLEHQGIPVATTVLIHRRVRVGGASIIRCNLSSWYAEPEFRGYGPLLIARALNRRDVTYFNISAAPETRPIIESQRFKRYSQGQFLTIGRSRLFGAVDADVAGPDTAARYFADPGDRDLLQDHAGYGCISFCCVSRNVAYPFVFEVRRLKGLVKYAQLIYCRDLKDYVVFARPISAHLASQGCGIALIDTNGPLAIPGVYLEGRAPKYFRGPARPRLGDLAYTEAVIFGF